MDSLPDVPGLADMAPSFRRAFVDMCREVGVDADHLAALISHESGFRPDAENPSSHSVGLIQWMPKYTGPGTPYPSTAELKKMSATEQLVYVAKFFSRWRGTLAPRDVAIAAGVPAYVGKPDAFVAIDRKKDPDTYSRNAALDRDRDGQITVGEIRDDVEALLMAAASRPRIPVPDGGGTIAAKPSGSVFGVVLLVVAGAWVLSKAHG